MLATLAMFVTGVAVLYAGAASARPATSMRVDTGVLAHDMRYFAIAYAIAIGAGLPAARAGLARSGSWPSVLIAIYAWYVKGHFEADPDVDASDLAPLRFRRLDPSVPPRRTRSRPACCASSTCRSSPRSA